MGVLTDLVIAEEHDAAHIATSKYPLGEFTGIAIKGVNSVKLATLHSILSGMPFKDLLVHYAPVAEASEEGPWVFLLPTDLVGKLANLSEAEIVNIAAQWGNTKEFQLDKWSQTDVAAVLGNIANLARKASAQEKRVLAWMSL
jgi:hypothetical protein